MTAMYIQYGNSFRVGSRESMTFHDNLPNGNYVLKFDDFRSEYFFEKLDDFTISTKLYGDVTTRASRILNTFKDRPNATGVLLVGNKGSGKTLLARQVAIQAASENIPVVIINSPFHGDGFNSFIQNMHQSMLILFDEFEKVYDDEEQESVLTLLDGVFPTKKLFMLTCNDKYKVNEFMRNRPGRIYYMFEFGTLDEQFTREYCLDNLKREYMGYLERIVQVSKLFGSFNFDMLKAIVEEINRYGEKPEVVIGVLNAKPEFGYKQLYTVEIYKNGKLIPSNWHSSYREIELLPFKPFNKSIHYYVPKTHKKTDSTEDDDDSTYVTVTFGFHDLKSFKDNVFEFQAGDEHTVRLSEKKYTAVNWGAF